MNFDLQTWTGIAALTTAIVGIVKKTQPWAAGKEGLLAIAISVGLATCSKASGLGFADEAWLQLLIAGVLAGAASGVIHDKVTNPLMGKGAS